MKQITTLNSEITIAVIRFIEICGFRTHKMLSDDQKPNKVHRCNISIQEKNISYTPHLTKLKYK
jgi:hypothetical protein